MKINEVETEAFRNHYRKKGLSEKQIDEILPALGAIAGVAGRVGAAAGRGIAAAGRGVAKGVGAIARGAAKAASTVTPTGYGSNTSTPTKFRSPSKFNTPSASNQQDPDEKDDEKISRALDKQIRPGVGLKLPTTQANKVASFKIKKSIGQDVEIENPRPAPGEPKSFVFNKDELKNALKGLQLN